MHILIAGSSGLIGTPLKAALSSHHQVRTLVRRAPVNDNEVQWEPDTRRIPLDSIEWADCIINLAGAPLTHLPWTRRTKQKILCSRTAATATIAQAISNAAKPPAALVNASAVGYYGSRPESDLDEESTPGPGFLADVVRRWETATPTTRGCRVVHIRTGIVLAQHGALAPIIATSRLGLGTVFGGGRQHWPWIALEDEVNAIVHLATGSDLHGPVNLVGPEPATCAEIVDEAARSLHRPRWFNVPRWALHLALGEAADDLLLADQKVVPAKLVADGFHFLHTTAADAVAAAAIRREHHQAS